MVRGLVGAACGLVLAAGLGAAWADDKPPMRGEYELELGGKRVVVEPGKPAELETHKGEKLRVVLHINPERTFDNYGFSFRYPREYRLSDDDEDGFRTVTVEAVESPLVLFQIFPDDPGGEPLIDSLLASFRDEFTGRGVPVGEIKEARATRKLGAETYAGKSLQFEALGQDLVVEIYALKMGDSALAVVFQHDREDVRIARKLFDAVMGSFKLKAAK